MGVQHELVKMNATLRLDDNSLERQVHEHGFAPPNAAPKVDTGKGIARRSEQPGEEATAGGIYDELVESSDGTRLRRIGLQLMGGNQLVVGGPNRTSHLDDGPLGRFTFFNVPLKL